MIVRKPYAFLIKNFKLIHLVMSILFVFLITRTTKILNFFRRYLINSLIDVVPNDYFNIFMYLAIIVIIVAAVAILFLFKEKKKPITFYIITIAGCIGILGCYIYFSSVISSLQYSIMDRKTISLARDITMFCLIGQYILIIPYVIRTIGFDIKKFDFKKDLEELNISVEDNEEFELTVGVDKNKLEQKARKSLRELKYYYVENKHFINIILAVIIVFFGYKIVTSIKINPTYKEGSVISLDNYYTLKFDESYITNKDSKGKEISVDGNTYLIVKFTVHSNYNGNITLNTDKFLVYINNEKFIANRGYYSYFSNYGIGYKGQKIAYNTDKTYILTYSIPDKYKNNKIRLEYEYRYDNNNEMIKKKVKLSPKIEN